MTPELARVLKHELAHTFINQLSAGRCPPAARGIAQLLEPKSLGGDGRPIGSVVQIANNIPLNVLEGSFLRFSGGQAYVAYAESLAAVPTSTTLTAWATFSASCNSSARATPTEAALRATHPLGLRPT